MYVPLYVLNGSVIFPPKLARHVLNKISIPISKITIDSNRGLVPLRTLSYFPNSLKKMTKTDRGVFSPVQIGLFGCFSTCTEIKKYLLFLFVRLVHPAHH